jgi:hypothetical protein
MHRWHSRHHLRKIEEADDLLTESRVGDEESNLHIDIVSRLIARREEDYPRHIAIGFPRWLLSHLDPSATAKRMAGGAICS